MFLRSLIDCIELHPRSEGKSVDAVLDGDLAEILGPLRSHGRQRKTRKKQPFRKPSPPGGCGGLQLTENWANCRLRSETELVSKAVEWLSEPRVRIRPSPP